MTSNSAPPSSSIHLSRLVARIVPFALLGEPGSLEVTSIAWHHEQVEPGSLYCCLPGQHYDGHDFAREAVSSGAVALVCEHSVKLGERAREQAGGQAGEQASGQAGEQASGQAGERAGARSAVQLVVGPGRARQAMAEAACAFYGDPSTSLATIGVTGTNGKTTTTYLLRSILERHGWPTGVIGTLDGTRTTPEAPDLQRALARQRDSGVRASALEVTSHALSQHRVDGICFDVAVFTNLSQDHLDYHETMEAYFEAKARLFVPERARLAVVNSDDPYGSRIAERAGIPVVAFALADAKDLEVGPAGSSFVLDGARVRLRLGGAFNVMNALAAAGAARSFGVPIATVAAGLEEVAGVPGRFERIGSPGGHEVVVDFAHTPAALEQVLAAARPIATPGCGSPGRLIVVFGCGGDRDKGKRPAMGAVVARFADVAFITTDNPRSEDPLAIIEQIRAGIGSGASAEIVLEPDRRLAIHRALGDARPGDVVVVAGKGHETTQQLADRAVRFSDQEVVREALAAMMPASSTPASSTPASSTPATGTAPPSGAASGAGTQGSGAGGQR